MGKMILDEFMPGLSRGRAAAFLFGCIQPDRNPATYLKGSLRARMLGGHNYSNAAPVMMRLALGLSGRERFSLRDCYRMGKLIHYIMDAFTFSHDHRAPAGLRFHRKYEQELQPYFLEHLKPMAVQPCKESAASLIGCAHRRYAAIPGCVESDTTFAIFVCCCLARRLTPERDSKPVNSARGSGASDPVLVFP